MLRDHRETVDFRWCGIVGTLMWAVLIAPGALDAQTPQQRTEINELREELAQVVDARSLAARESLTTDVARIDRDNPMIHLEMGFIAMRLGELEEGNTVRYNDAAGEFEWAAELAPDWPWPWYGLGLAELAIGEHEVAAIENIRQVMGNDRLSLAAGAFARAAEADPTFITAVLDLADIAQRQRIRPRTAVALEALRRTNLTDAAANRRVQLALGRISRLLGQADSALVAFNRYLELGGDSAAGWLEVARTEFALGATDVAAEHYFLGAQLIGSQDALNLYRNDIAWIGSEEELAGFDSADNIAEWLREFWTGRAVYDFRDPAERIQEHYRRVFYALDTFALPTSRRRFDPAAVYRSEQDEIDDRGIIYIRHGEPDRVARAAPGAAIPNAFADPENPAPVLEPNVSWQYLHPEDPLIFHFVAIEDVSDYRLVESLLDAYGFGNAITMAARNGAGADPELFASRGHMDPLYERMGFLGGRAHLLRQERERGQHSVDVGTSTDRFSRRFSDALNSMLLRYVLTGGNTDSASVLLVYGIKVEDLAVDSSSSLYSYQIDVRAHALNSEGAIAATADSGRSIRSVQPLSGPSYLLGAAELRLVPGRYVVRSMFRDPVSERGALYQLDEVVVPDPQVENAVSDLIAGLPGVGITWESESDTVHINASGRYPRGSRVDLYYEVLGVPRGTSYRARLEVKKRGGSVFGAIGRLFGGGDDRVEVEFTGVSAGAVTVIRQQVDLGDLEPGSYEVNLSAEFGDGTESERTAVIEIVD